MLNFWAEHRTGVKLPGKPGGPKVGNSWAQTEKCMNKGVGERKVKFLIQERQGVQDIQSKRGVLGRRR